MGAPSSGVLARMYRYSARTIIYGAGRAFSINSINISRAVINRYILKAAYDVDITESRWSNRCVCRGMAENGRDAIAGSDRRKVHSAAVGEGKIANDRVIVVGVGVRHVKDDGTGRPRKCSSIDGHIIGLLGKCGRGSGKQQYHREIDESRSPDGRPPCRRAPRRSERRESAVCMNCVASYAYAQRAPGPA